MIPFDLPADLPVVELAWPTRIILGPGALARLPAELARLGVGRPLVVTDAGVVKAGIAARLHRVLEEAGIHAARFEEVQPNPTDRDATEGLAAYRRGRCDGVVAIGGGSSIDAAKLVQLLTTHEPPLSRYDDAAGGDRFVRDDLPPLVAIPTTAGTGSRSAAPAWRRSPTPAGRPSSSARTCSRAWRSATRCSRWTCPRGSPRRPGWTPSRTGSRRTSRPGSTPSRTRSRSMRCAAPRAPCRSRCASRTNLHARADMMIAAMEGRWPSRRGSAPATRSPMRSGRSGVHHGLANAVVLPAVVAFNRPAAAARLARIAVAMGAEAQAGEGTLAEGRGPVRALAAEVGIPGRLREVGVREEDLPRIAAKAFEDASHRTNPRPCAEADLLAIARAAY
jgi:alcohol dehydrogenase class IV